MIMGIAIICLIVLVGYGGLIYACVGLISGTDNEDKEDA